MPRADASVRPAAPADPATIDRARYDQRDDVRLRYQSPRGISRKVVEEISSRKQEPAWVLEKRLKALAYFDARPVPGWGPDLSRLDLGDITYYAEPDMSEKKSWDEVPAEVRKTFDRLGIPEAERTYLAGSGAQMESTMAYHHLKERWEKLGVVFENFDVAIQKHPDLVREYFMTRCVPLNDHKFAALHGAVFSGGTFIYVPPNVKVTMPLQAYFRMNAAGTGQFEHTLIIVDEGAEVHYLEACSAPRYNRANLHAGCVEVYVKKGARARYTSIENWSKNTYNLNTKRAIVEEDGVMEWINGNLGCLTEDAKVFTNPGGPVSIKDLRPRDRVYTWNSRTNRIQKATVRAKVFSGRKEVYRVEAGGRALDATANHPFLSLAHRKRLPSHKKGFFHPEWRPLEALKPGDLVAVSKKLPLEGRPYVLPRVVFDPMVRFRSKHGVVYKKSMAHLYNQELRVPPETTADFMWLAGLLIGDGHVDLRQNKINIATHEREDYRDELCRTLKHLFNYEVTEKKERYIIVNSQLLCRLFVEIGLGGKNAEHKRVPSWVFGLPEDQRLAFLAGYFDSDGHTHPNALAFTSVSRELLEDVKLLAISLGFGVSRVFKHGDAGEVEILGVKCQAKNSWRIHLNGRRVYDLPVRCGAKSAKIARIQTRRDYSSASGKNFGSKVNDEIGFSRIERIVPLGPKPTWDIEVEGFHNFIANGFIVHNSGVTMLYPSSMLKGKGAKTDFIGIAVASEGQNQDTGSKAYHLAPHTKSTITAKSISKDGGITTYRGYLKVNQGAVGCSSKVQCDALLLDERSVSNTIPTMEVKESDVEVAHEATVGRIGEDQLFYLQSRGLSAAQATQMIVAGFIEPITKQLPLEYAVELNRLIEMEMEGSVG